MGLLYLYTTSMCICRYTNKHLLIKMHDTNIKIKIIRFLLSLAQSCRSSPYFYANSYSVACFSAVMLEAARCSEILVNFYHTVRCHMPEDTMLSTVLFYTT
jgi:hypothetical protein